jgi:hypothetical protein
MGMGNGDGDGVAERREGEAAGIARQAAAVASLRKRVDKPTTTTTERSYDPVPFATTMPYSASRRARESAMRVGRGSHRVFQVRLVQAAHGAAQLLRSAPDPAGATATFLATLGGALQPSQPPSSTPTRAAPTNSRASQKGNSFSKF